ncbi:Serine protease OS=Streptomyces fumanus OX=67302 GN=GCM10018772_44380 PE=3 SV=1 [Streptomyces fumanus]
MLHRRTRAVCAATAATAALFVAGLSGSTNAGATPAATPAAFRSSPTGASPTAAQTLRTDAAPPALLRALQRDLGLERGQAERRLADEAEAGATAGRLRLALGADYAGAWVRGAESGVLTVATTDAADVPAIEAQGARAAVVRHSLTDLDAAKARLDRGGALAGTPPTPRSATSTCPATQWSSRPSAPPRRAPC